MYQYHNQVPRSDAVKVEIKFTRPNGDEVRMVCDAFDYIEVEKFMEPEYFPPDSLIPNPPLTRIARLSINIERPRHWTIYTPVIEQPSIDDGNVVEEG